MTKLRRTFILVGGLFIIIPLLGIKWDIERLDILRSGKEVVVTIKEMPDNCSAKHKLCKISYGNIISTIRIDKDFCIHNHRGDEITLMHKDKYPKLFVFPNSLRKVYVEIVSRCLLMLFGSYVIIARNKLSQQIVDKKGIK